MLHSQIFKKSTATENIYFITNFCPNKQKNKKLSLVHKGVFLHLVKKCMNVD